MENAASPIDRFDLSTPQGRAAAERGLMIDDHGWIRAMFQNFHWIEPGRMARSNQPSPKHLERLKAQGFKTILNLRGISATGHYALEKAACRDLGLDLVDQPLGSREAPSKERILNLKRIFETIEYPALMHCKSGADRAGLAGVLYKHFQMGEPIETAIEQLDLKYLHMKAGKTGMLDFFFECYVKEGAGQGLSFLEWVEGPYDPAALKARFMASWWGTLLTEKILRRE